jgi:hypothetical protein
MTCQRCNHSKSYLSCNVRETVSELRELHTHFAETKEGILDLQHMSRQQSIENGHALSEILNAVSMIQSQVCGELTSSLDDDLNEQLESEDSCPSPSTYCHKPLSSATSTWISSSPSPIPDFDPQPNKE